VEYIDLKAEVKKKGGEYIVTCREFGLTVSTSDIDRGIIELDEAAKKLLKGLLSDHDNT